MLKLAAIVAFLACTSCVQAQTQPKAPLVPFIDPEAVVLNAQNFDTLGVKLFVRDQQKGFTPVGIAPPRSLSMFVLPSQGLAGLDSVVIWGFRQDQEPSQIHVLIAAPRKAGRVGVLVLGLVPETLVDPKTSRT